MGVEDSTSTQHHSTALLSDCVRTSGNSGDSES